MQTKPPAGVVLDVAALFAEGVTKRVTKSHLLQFEAYSMILLLTRHSVMYRLDISRILKTTISREP